MMVYIFEYENIKKNIHVLDSNAILSFYRLITGHTFGISKGKKERKRKGG
jgi:hypothetical protein